MPEELIPIGTLVRITKHNTLFGVGASNNEKYAGSLAVVRHHNSAKSKLWTYEIWVEEECVFLSAQRGDIEVVE